MYFTGEELEDPEISGPTADPNFTSLANVLEYSLGLDPNAVGGSLRTGLT